MELENEVLKGDESPILSATDNRSNSSNNLRKASIMLLLSISLILSLFLSLFTGLSFLHSYCYTFLVPLIAHTLERKYMFLLCNGILVFIARSSGFCPGYLASTSAGLQTDQEQQLVMLQPAAAAAPVDDDPLHAQDQHKKEVLSDLAEDEEEEEPHHRKVVMNNVVKEEEEGVMLQLPVDDSPLHAQDQHKKEVSDLAEDEGDLLVTDDEEKTLETDLLIGSGGEEDDGPSSNTEELNNKIEEFIRKMKEDLKHQADQLIAA